MSSSSATANSRSPSPATPESSHELDPVMIHADRDFVWDLSSREAAPNGFSWDHNSSGFMDTKHDDEPTLSFEDLIQEDAFEDPTVLDTNISAGHVTQSYPDALSSAPTGLPVSLHTLQESLELADFLLPASLPAATKVEPPPASRSRQRESSACSQKVVYPPKDACFRLPILTPTIPETGTKSRVETQIRVTLDLALGTSPAGEPFRYDRVGTWKWLKLPKGTSTKRRTRKEGKIDPTPDQMLHMGLEISCATPPHTRVVSCQSCQNREAKRVARKIASRIRPPRSDSDSPEDAPSGSGKNKSEDTSSIVQFNCPEIMDFSSGSVILPLRITCYCRHHREKVGFIVHFTMTDHAGRVVGIGSTPPIMITDDHKTTGLKQPPVLQNSLGLATGSDWSFLNNIPNDTVSRPEVTPPPRTVNGRKDSVAIGKKRAKPYDRTKSRRSSVISSPLNSEPTTRSASPMPFAASPPGSVPQSAFSLASFDQGWSPGRPSREATLRTNEVMDGILPILQEAAAMQAFLPTAPPSPEVQTVGLTLPSPVANAAAAHAMPFLMFGTPNGVPALPAPVIRRLVPPKGPTHGGTEVTILGANFHGSMNLRCVFGDAVATSTQRWSDNTLVCIVPPRMIPGVVVVSFEGVEKVQDGSPAALYTYEDESDKALMELALQVLGLKMTGKVEDAKNVAMRIVGSVGAEDPQPMDSSNMMQVMSSSGPTSSYARALRHLASPAESGTANLEQLVMNVLQLLDVPLENSVCTQLPTAISFQSDSGQTLLHLAVSLGFTEIIDFLLEHEIDVDVRDRNGYTAMHFAAVTGSKACARLLWAAGADMEVVDGLGRAPGELASAGFFDDMPPRADDDEHSSDAEDEEEADWGDAENELDSPSIIPRVLRQVASRKASAAVSRISTPPIPEAVEDKELLKKEVATSEKSAVGGASEKNASYAELIQRTLAQLQFLPYLPQGLHLPGIPAVPWNALPQIPMVFPILVPTAGWSALLGEKRTPADGDAPEPESAAVRAAGEWRAFWEKLMAQAMAGAGVARQEEDEAPPVYTPRDQVETVAGPSTTPAQRVARRPHDIATGAVPEQVVAEYEHRPTRKTLTRMKKVKDDRMLVFFWIPMLFAGFMWALVTAIGIALQGIKAMLANKTGIRL